MPVTTAQLEAELQLLALVGPPITGTLDGSNARFLANREQQAREIWTGFEEAAAHVRGDNTLSDVGVRARLAELGRVELERLDQLFTKSEREVIDQDIAKARAALVERPAPVNDAAAKIESVWHRDRLLAVDPLMRPALLTEAVESGDARLFSAFVDCPPWLRLVEPSALAEAVRAWGEAHSPAVAQELADLERAKAQLLNTLRIVRGQIAAAAGLGSALELLAIEGNAAG